MTAFALCLMFFAGLLAVWVGAQDRKLAPLSAIGALLVCWSMAEAAYRLDLL